MSNGNTPAERRGGERFVARNVEVELFNRRYRAENINITGVKILFKGEAPVLVNDVVDLIIVEEEFQLPLTGKVVWLRDNEGSLGVEFQWKSEKVASLVRKIMGDSADND